MNEPPQAPEPQKRGGCVKGCLTVVAIGAALFALSVYRFMNHPSGVRNGENDVRINLGSIRTALSVYYDDMEGVYPADLGTVGASLYNKRIPRIWSGDDVTDSFFPARRPDVPHPFSAEVEYFDERIPRDSGRWGYVSNPTDANFGTVFVDCTHTDSRGDLWHTY